VAQQWDAPYFAKYFDLFDGTVTSKLCLFDALISQDFKVAFLA
jgi:hypothetical protein